MVHSFFEPYTAKGKTIKWAVIFLIFLVGAGILLLNLDDIITYERISREPAYVEATISVVKEGFFIESYTEYLSYSYAGISYENIFYHSSQNSSNIHDDGKTVTVAVNPENPSQLVHRIVENDFAIVAAMLLLSIGAAMMEYGIAIEFAAFRNWRSKTAKRKYKLSFDPDYVADVAVISLVNLIVIHVVMLLVFPSAFGLTRFFESL